MFDLKNIISPEDLSKAIEENKITIQI